MGREEPVGMGRRECGEGVLGEEVEGGFAMPNGSQHCGRNNKVTEIMGLFFMFPLNEILLTTSVLTCSYIKVKTSSPGPRLLGV